MGGRAQFCKAIARSTVQYIGNPPLKGLVPGNKAIYICSGQAILVWPEFRNAQAAARLGVFVLANNLERNINNPVALSV